METATTKEIAKILQLTPKQVWGFISKLDIQKSRDINGTIFYDKYKAIESISNYLHRVVRDRSTDSKWLLVEDIAKNYNLNKKTVLEWLENTNIRDIVVRGVKAYHRIDAQNIIKDRMFKVLNIIEELDTYSYYADEILKKENISISIISNGRYVDLKGYELLKKGILENKKDKEVGRTTYKTYQKKLVKDNQVKIKNTYPIEGSVLRVFKNNTFIFMDKDKGGAIDCSFLPRTETPTIEEIRALTWIKGGYLTKTQTLQGSKYLKMFYITEWQ